MIPARMWIRETFVQGGRPTLRKVQRWVEEGHVPGRYIDDELYIDDSFATHQPRAVKPRARVDVLS